MKNAILHLNWLAVLGSAAAYFALGAIWYSKMLFANYWGKVYNVNMNDRSGFIRVMIVGFALTFLICMTIGLMLNAIRCRESFDCFTRSYVLVAGIIVGVMGMSLNYQRKPFGIYVVDILYHLLGALIACLILSKWGMSAPM